jgi:hypothetical protein
MQISDEGKIGIALGLLGLGGGGALFVLPHPYADYVGWTLIAVSVFGLVLLGLHHFKVRIDGVKEMWPQYLMVTAGILFFVGLVAFLQKNVNPPEHATSGSPNPQRSQEISDGLNQIAPIVEALKGSQKALAESEQTKNLLGRVTAHLDQLEAGIAAREQFTKNKLTEDRLAAAEHIFRELKVILGDTQKYQTPQGQGLIIKTSPNTFRITFPVQMRVAPTLTFTNLPVGSEAKIIERSTLGATVVFVPPTIPVEHFGLMADAEL